MSTSDRETPGERGRPGVSDSGPDVEALFDAYAPALLRYLAQRVEMSTAQDLVSQTFETILSGRARFDAERGTERAWLFGIATNHLRHHLRSRARERSALERVATHEAAVPARAESESDRVTGRVDAAERVRRLAARLDAMNASDRELLLLVCWGHLSPTEAAASLGIRPGTARSRLHRIRGALRTYLTTVDAIEQEA